MKLFRRFVEPKTTALFLATASLLAGGALAQDGDGGDQTGGDPGDPGQPCETCEPEECEGAWTLIDDPSESKVDYSSDSCGVIASGFGSAGVVAFGDSVLGSANAYDAVFHCDITVQASAPGQIYAKYKYNATKGPKVAKAEVDYHLDISGELDLKKAESSAALGGFVAFDTNLGIDESLEVAFGRATGSGSGSSVKIPGPKGTEITITIAAGTNEGSYTAPAPASKNGSSGEKCVAMVTVQQRTMGYVEAFADGGLFALDEAWATVDMRGTATKGLALGACCESDY